MRRDALVARLGVHRLVDYESVQPADLESLADGEARVTVFVGAHQNRLPFDFAAGMQALGERGRYVKIAVPGKNALDFQLAFELGRLVERDPGAVYRIVSRDSGFDPPVRRLREQGFAVERTVGLGAEADGPTTTDASDTEPADSGSDASGT